MDCDFEVEPLADASFRLVCRNCGDAEIKATEKYTKMCRLSPPAEYPPGLLPLAVPSMGRRIVNFTKAAIGHALSAFPTCSDVEIAERHAICKACELYAPSPDNPEVGTCSHPDCGCCIQRDDTFLSKLAWADQECPLKKWLAIQRPPAD